MRSRSSLTSLLPVVMVLLTVAQGIFNPGTTPSAQEPTAAFQPMDVFGLEMPALPDGADWGPPFRVIDKMNYRADGSPGALP